MAAASPVLRIRLTSVVAKNDALLIGDRVVMLERLSDFGYSAKWDCVTVKVVCHADWIMTDATKQDWDAYLATKESGT